MIIFRFYWVNLSNIAVEFSWKNVCSANARSFTVHVAYLCDISSLLSSATPGLRVLACVPLGPCCVLVQLRVLFCKTRQQINGSKPWGKTHIWKHNWVLGKALYNLHWMPFLFLHPFLLQCTAWSQSLEETVCVAGFFFIRARNQNPHIGELWLLIFLRQLHL